MAEASPSNVSDYDSVRFATALGPASRGQHRQEIGAVRDVGVGPPPPGAGVGPGLTPEQAHMSTHSTPTSGPPIPLAPGVVDHVMQTLSDKVFMKCDEY